MNEKINIFPLGENALTVDFGRVISSGINAKVSVLSKYFESTGFPGFIEIVPAYTSLTIFYDLIKVRNAFREFPTAFAAVKNFVESILSNKLQVEENGSEVLEIPVDFSERYALDLEIVADLNKLTKEQVIKIFTRESYRVFMLGFFPGFAYMGEIDRRIAAPRKSSPRRFVAAGSVGIAGRQTGIYPFDSPGGWQIIGKTDVRLFDAKKACPTYFQAGDLVKFYQV